MSLWNDVRFGVRSLAKAPGFAATAILTMAFGIGATTSIFSCADAMLWKPIPLPDIDSMAMVLQRVGIALADRLREVSAELARQIGIIGDRRFKQLVVQAKLGVSEQYRKLRPRERL